MTTRGLRRPFVFLFLILCGLIQSCWGVSQTNVVPHYDPATQREFQNVYQAIKNPVITLATISSATITSLTISTMTVSSATFTGISVPWMTDWASSTPATSGFGTISGAVYYTRRVGDTLEGIFYWKAGVVAGTVGKVTLPNSLSADTTKFLGDSRNLVGIFVFTSGGGGTASFTTAGTLGVNSSDATNIYFSSTNGSDASANTLPSQNVSVFLNPNGAVSGKFAVPISGWTSGH